jgi:hypothetical protein
LSPRMLITTPVILVQIGNVVLLSIYCL